MFNRSLLISMFLIVLLPTITRAQTKVTFRIDMRPQIKDSTFTLGESAIALSGNQLPFSNLRTIKLKDKPPRDSIYVTTIHFPSPTNGTVLKYKFLIKKNDQKIIERRSRLLQLQGQRRVLPTTSFNNFVN